MMDMPHLTDLDAFSPQPEPLGMILTFMDCEGIVENGEFLVRDTALAEKLGFVHGRNIRKIIERNRTELEGYGPLLQRGAMVDIGSGAKREVTEFYLNQKQALILIGYSNAPNASEIKRLMIAVFEAFIRGWHALTAEQALDRLAAEETSLAHASEGAEIQLRQAAALEAEARRIKEAALAVRATRNDRLALMSASRQILETKETLPANQTMFGLQLIKLYSDAAVMGTTRRRASE